MTLKAGTLSTSLALAACSLPVVLARAEVLAPAAVEVAVVVSSGVDANPPGFAGGGWQATSASVRRGRDRTDRA